MARVEQLDGGCDSEGRIKAAILERLRSDGPTPVVANEYCLGRTSVRVDLAVLGTELTGIEIKSSRDTLKRLPKQISAYSRYFDRFVVVVAGCHLRQLDWKALASAFVWRVDDQGNLDCVAEPTEIPQLEKLSDLMTAEQIARHGLTEASSDALVHERFRDEFRARFGPTSRAFWEAVDGRPIRAHDVGQLSRFKERRSVVADWRAAQDAEWSEWNDQVTRLLGRAA